MIKVNFLRRISAASVSEERLKKATAIRASTSVLSFSKTKSPIPWLKNSILSRLHWTNRLLSPELRSESLRPRPPCNLYHPGQRVWPNTYQSELIEINLELDATGIIVSPLFLVLFAVLVWMVVVTFFGKLA